MYRKDTYKKCILSEFQSKRGRQVKLHQSATQALLQRNDIHILINDSFNGTKYELRNYFADKTISAVAHWICMQYMPTIKIIPTIFIPNLHSTNPSIPTLV